MFDWIDISLTFDCIDISLLFDCFFELTLERVADLKKKLANFFIVMDTILVLRNVRGELFTKTRDGAQFLPFMKYSLATFFRWPVGDGSFC